MHEFKTDPTRPGVMKASNGDMYKQALAVLLRTNRVALDEHGAFGDDKGEGPEHLESLYTQLRAFSRVPVSGQRSATGAVKYKWQGKHAGKDDLVIALQQAVYYMLIYLVSPRYDKVRGEPPRTLRGLETIGGVLEHQSERMSVEDVRELRGAFGEFYA
jgi:hypothetical protein